VSKTFNPSVCSVSELVNRMASQGWYLDFQKKIEKNADGTVEIYFKSKK
jgi:hypothetical protein